MAELMKRTNNGWELYDEQRNLVLSIGDNAAVSDNFCLLQELTALDNSISGSDRTNIRKILQNFSDRLNSLEGTCLKEDTAILMANGTVKYIKDVKYGDYVKGWDFENQRAINVKAYGVIKTGTSKSWDIQIFEDGTILEVAENHLIYNCEKGFTYGSAYWKSGEHGINSYGEEVAFAKAYKQHDSTFVGRYVLLTETSNYFANGILCGHKALDKYSYYNQGISTYIENITAEDLAYFKQTADIMDASSRKETNIRSFIKQAAPYMAKINAARTKIAECKKQLSDNDYKTIKHYQGELSDFEFQIACNEARENRNEIAIQEQIIEEQEIVIAQVRQVYGLTKETAKTRYDDCYAIEIAHARANGYN